MKAAAPLLRWSWLLTVALLAPAALPAGGGERRLPQVRRRASGGSGPMHTADSCSLRLSPMVVAPRLGRLHGGTPLRLLHHWAGDDGLDWLYVQELTGSSRRGWLRA